MVGIALHNILITTYTLQSTSLGRTQTKAPMFSDTLKNLNSFSGKFRKKSELIRKKIGDFSKEIAKFAH